MTPHRALDRSSPPKHTVPILAALGCSCLVLSGVTGLASLLGWVVAGLILAGIVVAALALLGVCLVIANRDNAIDLPGAME
jgi:hypothetical protein